MSRLRLPLALSVAGHALVVAALMLYVAKPPTLLQRPATGGIEIVFAPPPPPAPPPQAAPEKPPEPEPPPPPPEPPPRPEPPPPKLVEKPPPPPPRKPIVRPAPRPVARHIEVPPPRPQRTFIEPEPQPRLMRPPPPLPEAPPRQSAPAPTPVPAPVPSPVVSPGYQAALRSWLENHKHYPDAARQRGEEGRAVLRFEVERSGRVLGYTILKSSGYPDLDAAVEEMMRGATLPPFPAGMTQPSITVSVTIRFSLSS